MEIAYTDLKTFCDRSNITYQEFGSMVDKEHSVSWCAIYKAISGKSNPGKRTRRVLDRFISSHESDIRAALNKKSA